MRSYKHKPMASYDEKIKHWMQVEEEFEDSGLSRAAFCRKHEIAHSTFHTWQKKINAYLQKSNTATEPQLPPKQINFVPVKVKSNTQNVEISEDVRDNNIEITLPSGIKLKISQGANIDNLTKIIDILR